MALQNRVTPFGELVATPERGMFIGNRGIIHDPATRTLTARRWTTKSWIICNCEFKDRHRDVWAARSWTELFFLDEATALAAGHRPCFECRRRAAEAFSEAWAVGNGTTRPRAKEMDAVLHAERTGPKSAKRQYPLAGPAADLPDGTLVAAGRDAYLVRHSRLRRWTFGGYGPDQAVTGQLALLTPPSTLAALRAGYRPHLHPSATG
jgi:hypothetical protein